MDFHVFLIRHSVTLSNDHGVFRPSMLGAVTPCCLPSSNSTCTPQVPYYTMLIAFTILVLPSPLRLWYICDRSVSISTNNCLYLMVYGKSPLVYDVRQTPPIFWGRPVVILCLVPLYINHCHTIVLFAS